QHGPSLSQSVVECERALGRTTGIRQCLIGRERAAERARPKLQVSGRQTRMCCSIVGVERQSLLKLTKGLHRRKCREDLQIGARLQLQKVRIGNPWPVTMQIAAIKW